jgi:hypothetical protein
METLRQWRNGARDSPMVALIEKGWAEHLFQGLVLLGQHENLEHLRKRLPQRIAGQMVHEGPCPWTEEPRAIEEEILAILIGTMKSHEEQLLVDLRQRLRDNHRVAAGPAQVMEAIEKGRIRPQGYGYLVFGPDPREVLARFTACRSLALEVPRVCPCCQAPCV